MANVKISQLPQTSVVCNNALIPLVQNGVTCSTYACNLGASTPAIFIAGSGCNSSIRCGVGNSASGAYSSALGGSTNCNTGINTGIVSGALNIIGCYNLAGATCLTTSSYVYCANPATNSIYMYGDYTADIQVGNCLAYFNCYDNKTYSGVVTCSTYSGSYTEIKGICAGACCGNICTPIRNFSCVCNVLSNFSIIGDGVSNIVSAQCSSIVGGANNLIDVNSGSSIIGGGCENTISSYSAYATISGGRNNIISASAGGGNVTGGFYNTSSGVYSSILGGIFNTASGFSSSVSGGRGHTASGFNSTINGGYQNIASGCYSMAMGGFRNCAIADCSIAGGGQCNLSLCPYSTSIGGCCNRAFGNYSSILGGSGSNAYGCNSSVLGGCQSRSDGDFSAVVGGCSNASDIYGFSGGGCDNLAGCYSAVVGGFCNLAQFYSFVGSGCCNIAQGCNSGAGGCGVNNSCNNTFQWNCLRASNLIGTTVAVCVGTDGILVRGTSDMRCKTDITPISYGLNEVSMLKPVSFNWCDDIKSKFGDNRQVGFIAQEVEKVIPEAVGQSADGTYSMDINKIVPALVKSVQEMKSCIDELKNSMKNTNSSL